jgi:hypothetical protein
MNSSLVYFCDFPQNLHPQTWACHDCLNPYSSLWIFNNIPPTHLNITDAVEKASLHKLQTGIAEEKEINHAENFYSEFS